MRRNRHRASVNALPGPGRPRTRPVTPTPFSRWLGEQITRCGLTPGGAAETLGVHQATVYDWLAGIDPRASHLIQAGIAATLNGGRNSAHSSQAYAAIEPAPAGDEMPDMYERVEVKLREIFWKTKWQTREAKALVSMIEAMAPADSEPVRGKKSSARVP